MRGGVQRRHASARGLLPLSKSFRVIARSAQSGYRNGRARSRHNSDHSAASAQLECAICDGVFHTSLLRRELFEERSSESVELLPSAGRSR